MWCSLLLMELKLNQLYISCVQISEATIRTKLGYGNDGCINIFISVQEIVTRTYTLGSKSDTLPKDSKNYKITTYYTCLQVFYYCYSFYSLVDTPRYLNT